MAAAARGRKAAAPGGEGGQRVGAASETAPAGARTLTLGACAGGGVTKRAVGEYFEKVGHWCLRTFSRTDTGCSRFFSAVGGAWMSSEKEDLTTVL